MVLPELELNFSEQVVCKALLDRKLGPAFKDLVLVLPKNQGFREQMRKGKLFTN